MRFLTVLAAIEDPEGVGRLLADPLGLVLQGVREAPIDRGVDAR